MNIEQKNLERLKRKAAAWNASPKAKRAIASLEKRVKATSLEVDRLSKVDPDLRQHRITI